MAELKAGTISVDFKEFYIKSTPYHCWPPRGENLVILINKAFELISVEERKQMKPFRATFDINDWGEGKYSIASDKYSEKAIPCFSFIHWKQGNIDDYTNICENIAHDGKKPYKFEKIFWRGFLSHPTRKMFLQKYRNNLKVDALECNIMWGAMHQDNPIHNRPEIIQTHYASLPDHCKYKYLLDMQGGGYSARTKFLMHSKRPIFYQNRKFHEYWFWDLKPFIHYIPVDENFLDFDEKINWAETHPQECNQIAENAYEYARTKLRRQDAILRLKNILFKLGTGELK